MKNIEMRRVKDLKPHHKNQYIYNDMADTALIESISKNGILDPLIVTTDNRIVSGHRRLDAAKKCSMEEVPVIVFASDDELEIRKAIIHCNVSRQKTNEQLAREARELLEIERELAKKRQAGGMGQSVPVNLPEATGDARDLVGKAIGKSGRTVDKLVKLDETLEVLKQDDPQNHLEPLRTALNEKSVDWAYNYARRNNLLGLRIQEKSSNYITLEAWKGLSEEEKRTILRKNDAGGNKQFNPTNDSIEWARWTWNPVTGCLHDCDFCYAKHQAHLHYTQIEGDRFQPIFYPDRLSAPYNTKPKDKKFDNPVDRIGHKTVFCCSMADLFGKWVPHEWIETVLSIIKETPQWNYVLLTKNPMRYRGIDFPDNAWVGVTVHKQNRVKVAERAFKEVKAKVKFLSCEPMLDELTFSEIELFDWVIVGGASKTPTFKETKPQRKWINHIEDQAKKANLPVYEKTNLLERIREYPKAIQ